MQPAQPLLTAAHPNEGETPRTLQQAHSIKKGRGTRESERNSALLVPPEEQWPGRNPTKAWFRGWPCCPWDSTWHKVINCTFTAVKLACISERKKQKNKKRKKKTTENYFRADYDYIPILFSIFCLNREHSVSP